MQLLILSQAVGRNAPNRPADVMNLHRVLMTIGKIPCYRSTGQIDAEIVKGIEAVQRHFMLRPDGVVSPLGPTRSALERWSDKPVSPGVQLVGRLREAWEWVSPLLPEGSYCSSGFRSAEDQRRILHKFFTDTYRKAIITKYSQSAYDLAASNLIANEAKVLEMVRGVGQAIAAPGKSMHQQGRAVDIGGPSTIDPLQVEAVKAVARAHPELFTGTVLKERNGCVHFEIR
jgi:hypothetical protein